MVETNAFLVMFAVLVLTVSVMHMLLLTRFVRLKMAEVPDEYFAQLSPPVDRHRSTEQFISRYRVAHAVHALLGMLLLGWLGTYLQRPDWDKRWVVFPVVCYFALQWVPMAVAALTGFKHFKVYRSFLAQAKRKAVLKRRGLFDFISPLAVYGGALAYLLFVGVMLVIPLAPMARAVFIGTAVFEGLLTAFSVYRMLYGRKSDPFETHAGRLYTIGLRIKTAVYTAIAVILFLAFVIAVIQTGLDRWMPFSLAAFLTFITLLMLRVYAPPPRRADDDVLDSNEVAP